MELQAENWRPCSTTLVRGVSGELVQEYNFSTRSIWGAGTRVSHKSVPARASHNSVLQECPTRVSYKSVPQECPASDPQEWSYKSGTLS